MSVTKFIAVVAATGALALPVALGSTSASAASATTHVGQGCNVFEYIAHWATTHKSRAVVLSEYQLNLAPKSTFSKSEEEDNVNSVSSKVAVSSSVKGSVSGVFASVEASVKGSVAKFGQHTSKKIVKTTLTVRNTSKNQQKTYVIFNGVTQYTGTAKYYDCVSHDKSGIGTVKVTNQAPWKTYSTRGGGSVKCRTHNTSKLGMAAEVYC